MIIADFGVSAVNPSVVNPSSNVRTYFPVPGTSTPSLTDATGQLAFPSGFKGQRVKAVLAGDITTADAYNVTISLQSQTGAVLTTPVYTNLAFAPQNPGMAKTFPWFLVVEFEGTTLSGLGGRFYGSMNNSVVPDSILSSTLSGIDPNAGFGLVANVKFSTGDPGNSASLYQFQLLSE